MMGQTAFAEKRGDINMIFYTSDLHFGHANAIKFDDRPFADVEEMNKAMIHNWNSRVGKNDTVYILGDFSFRLKDPEPILARLKGHKRLILGNHDQVIMGSEKLQSYFDDIQKMDYVSDRDKLIVMCHYPIAEWNKKNRGAYHFYGHIHKSSPEVYRFMTSQGRAYNAGCMLNNYMPCTADEVIRNNEIYQQTIQSL